MSVDQGAGGARGGIRCWDLFPYAECGPLLPGRRLARIPGWYPPLTDILPMSVSRALPLGRVMRPAAYCRVLGRGGGGAEALGGFQAVLLRDRQDWPLFRFARLLVPHDAELSREEILDRLLDDGLRIARGLGVVEVQAVLLQTAGSGLPGFPVEWSAFGPLPDDGLGDLLERRGFESRGGGEFWRARVELLTGLAADPRIDAAGRPFRWGIEDMRRYQRLWADYCARHLPELLFLASWQPPMDPFLQRFLGPEEELARIRFWERGGRPLALTSWYPDAYPVVAEPGLSGAEMRLRLAHLDPAAVTRVKLLKCLGPAGDDPEASRILGRALLDVARQAGAAHPRLEWLEVGPVPGTDQLLIERLKGMGFERFGELRVHAFHQRRGS